METVKPRRYRWVILGCSFALMFFTYATLLSVTTVEGNVRQDLGISFADSGFLISVAVLMLVISAVPGGYLGDKIGFRKAAGIGVILVAAGGLLRGFSAEYLTLVGFTAMFGVGWGLVLVNMPKLVVRWFPPKSIGTASGVYGAGAAIGATATLSLTLPFVYPIAGSWQGVFYVWGIFTFVVAAAWWTLVREGAGLANPNPPTATPYARVQGQPEGRRNVLRSRKLWVLSFVFLTNNIVYYTEISWLSSFFVEKGAALDTGLLLVSALTISVAPAIIILPAISDRVGRRKPFMWLSALVSSAVALVIVWTPVQFDWVTAVALGVTVVGTFVFPLIMVVELFPAAYVGRATGLLLAIGYLGGVSGPWLVGLARDITGQFLSVPIIIIVASIMGAVLAATLPETGIKKIRHND